MPNEPSPGGSNSGSFFGRFHEVYVDLFGSLLPGLFTVVIGGYVIAFTFSAIYGMRFSAAASNPSIFWFSQQFIDRLHFQISAVVLVVSYIVGSTFFRQDPKRPDENSALYAWLKSKPEERRGLAVQSEAGIDDPVRLGLLDRVLAALWPSRYTNRHRLDTQFPYLHLRCYLGARGLTHLTKYVPWCIGDIESTKGYRTKMFLNILKIRLQSLTPALCKDIVRNEAHVRLATSLWYSANWLFLIAGFCQICLLAALGLALHGKSESALQATYAPGVTAAFVMAICVAMRFHLRKCIHYMRVREVVYVLEASHLASQSEPAFNISDLIQKDTADVCLTCPRLKSEKPARPNCSK